MFADYDGRMPDVTRLARLFAEIWGASRAGCGIDDSELQEMITRIGLAEWQATPENEVRHSGLDPNVGYLRVVLTEEGRRVLQGRSGQADNGYPVYVTKSWVDEVCERFAYATRNSFTVPCLCQATAFAAVQKPLPG